MTAYSDPLFWGLVTAVAAILAFAPMHLVREVTERPVALLEHLVLFGVLLGLGTAIGAIPAAGPQRQILNAVLVICATATVYYDARFLVIPDLVHLVLCALALLNLNQLGWRASLLGGGLSAALLYAVAVGYHRYAGVEGLGLADIKLSGAMGFLLGLEQSLWMIAGAALTGSLFAYAKQRFSRDRDHPAPIPLGAFLAFFGSGLFLCRG